MVTIMCSHCEYIGNGDSIEERVQDVVEHEKICKTKKQNDENNGYGVDMF